jgi:hypothetical protein
MRAGSGSVRRVLVGGEGGLSDTVPGDLFRDAIARVADRSAIAVSLSNQTHTSM